MRKAGGAGHQGNGTIFLLSTTKEGCRGTRTCTDYRNGQEHRPIAD